MEKIKKFLLGFSFLFSLTSCQFIFGGSTSSSDKPSANDKPETVSVYSFNDLHGSYEDAQSLNEPGWARLDHAIKNDPDYDPETSVILCCGDLFQGGYLAHEDRTLGNRLMEDMNVDCMIVGNHEFDWGTDVLKALAEDTEIPYLGCNILSDDKGEKPSFLKGSQILDKGGVRYGIIGAIGPNQESSISAGKLGDFNFSNDLIYVQNELEDLRKAKCDIILMGIHASEDDEYVEAATRMWDYTSISGIFGGHTHQFKSLMVNDTPYVQAGGNTCGYTKMVFKLDEVRATKRTYVNLSSKSDIYNIPESELNQDMIGHLDKANRDHPEGNVKLSHFNGDFDSYRELNKFVPDAMMYTAKKYQWKQANELIAVHNLAGIRSSIPSGDVTQKILFKVSPFDNKVKVIQNVPGYKLSSLFGSVENKHKTSYYAYSTETDTMFSSNKTYDVITIDFVCEGTYWTRLNIDSPQFDLVEGGYFIRESFVEFLQTQPVFNASDYYPY